MDRVTQLYLRKGCTGTECHNYTRSRDIQSTPTEPEAGIYLGTPTVPETGMYRVPQLYLRPSGVTAMISILVLRAISRFKVLAEVKLPYDKD